MKLGYGLVRAGLLALFILGIGGCMESPLAPVTGAGSGGTAPTGPELLAVEPDGSAGWTPMTAEATMDSMPVTSRGLQVCVDVDGSKGGRIQCGRFVLSVPPDAFAGTGTICMSMRDTTVMVVDLKIDPDSLNAFAVPVKLCLITQDASVDEKDVSIYWYDPALDNWTGMVCDRDLSNDLDVTGGTYSKGVLTLLGHFSTYSGGKAGW